MHTMNRGKFARITLDTGVNFTRKVAIRLQWITFGKMVLSPYYL